MCEPLNKKVKRCFSEAWLTDIRFKSWIEKVESDESLFHCRLCNKNFSCCWSHVERHANSKWHKEKKGTLLVPRRSQKRKFRQQWLDIELIKPWLRQVLHNEYAFSCLFCDLTIVGGLSQIYCHENSVAHKEKCEKNILETDSNNIQENESHLSFDERKKIAEIRYAAFIAEKNISHETAKEILTFFQEIGKDSDILQKMNINRSKCTNVITNVLCPVETQRVVNSIQNTKFSIFIDETSDISNKKWLTFFVRFVDLATLEIRSQLLKLININAQNSSAEELFKAFEKEMYKFHFLIL